MSRFIKSPPIVEGSRLARIQEALRPGSHLDMSKRDPAFRTPTSAHVAAKPVEKMPEAKTAPVARYVDPVADAKIAARVRCSIVMKSDSFAGREKQAEQLLLDSCSHNSKFGSSTAIINELHKRPTDADRAEKATADRQAKADATWAKVYPDTSGNNASGLKPAELASDAVWVRAWGNVASAATVDSDPAKRTTDAVWAKAWASPDRSGNHPRNAA